MRHCFSHASLAASSVPHAGKTVCAVDVCQDVGIRGHFARLAWVSIGQEALIEELQEQIARLQQSLVGVPPAGAAEPDRDLHA